MQGIETASREEGVNVDVNYRYCTGEDSRDSILSMASKWYEEGCQAIFACGSYVEQPVIEAAELADKKVIAFETEKSQLSDKIMTSAVKDIQGALTKALEQYKSDEFPGGAVVEYNAENDGISLDMKNSRFERFTEDSYETVLEGLADGSIVVKNHSDGGIDDLRLSNVTVVEK